MRRRLFLFSMFVVACGGKKKAKNPDEAGEEESGELQIEYVPLSILWVAKHIKGKVEDSSPKALDAAARDTARKIADDMLSKMQSSTESLDSIAEAVINARLGQAAIKDPKRRKAVTLPVAKCGEADLPPDAKEALATFARKAKAGDVVDSPLGSGPVLLVARASRYSW